MKDDFVYLHHIAECIRRIDSNVDAGLDEFLASETIQDATLRNLQTMSEATQRLSDEIKFSQPDIEWDQISAFRNILVHNYLGIDLEMIWNNIQRDLPAFKHAVDEMLRNLSKNT